MIEINDIDCRLALHRRSDFDLPAPVCKQGQSDFKYGAAGGVENHIGSAPVSQFLHCAHGIRAIVVTGDKFEVIGKWKVAVHDNTRVYQPWEKPYFVLQLGDVYNMKTRKVEKYGIGSPVPVAEIKKK